MKILNEIESFEKKNQNGNLNKNENFEKKLFEN